MAGILPFLFCLSLGVGWTFGEGLALGVGCDFFVCLTRPEAASTCEVGLALGVDWTFGAGFENSGTMELISAQGVQDGAKAIKVNINKRSPEWGTLTGLTLKLGPLFRQN